MCIRDRLTIDQIHYDHCIYKGHFKEGRDYLAVNSNVKIWNLYRMDGDMHILCDAMDPVRWQLVEMGYDVRNKNIYEYPVFGNVNQQQQFNCICLLYTSHHALLEEAREMRLEASIVIVISDYKNVRWAHAGNTRLVLMRNGRIKYLSLIHIYLRKELSNLWK